jgi:hypothetical protein
MPSSPRALVSSLVLALSLTTIACSTPSSAPDPGQPGQPAQSAGSEGVEPSPGAIDGGTDGVPMIASDEATFDFGTITPTDKVTHVFEIVNRGTADLTIERVERT